MNSKQSVHDSSNPNAKDFAIIDGMLMKLGNKKVLPAAEKMASEIDSARIAYRLYRAAALHGHHKIGEFFLARYSELQAAA